MNQRVMLTKRLIQESLLRLLKEKEIHRITVKELCADAGINRSTFYAHYKVPRDVLYEMLCNSSERIREIVQSQPGLSLREQLLASCEYIYANRDVQRILILNTTIDEIQTLMRTISFRFVFSPVSFPVGDAPDQVAEELAGLFLSSGLYHLIRRWIVDEVDITPEGIVNIIMSMAENMLGDGSHH